MKAQAVQSIQMKPNQQKKAMMINEKMLIFLMFTMFFVLKDSVFFLNVSIHPYGMITLLESIIERVMLEMIIIEILALRPPKNTMTEIKTFPNF